MKQQVVLVTGACGGMGSAVVREFIRRGCIVYGADRNKERFADLQATGCHPIYIDVTNDTSMSSAVNEIEAKHGAVNILVNCAGYSQGGPLEELPIAALRNQFEVNVFGMVRLIQLVLPGMRYQGFGRIINISSIAGAITMPGMGAYAMSKHAVECLTEAFRYEVKRFGVRAVYIEPGGTASHFARTETALFKYGKEQGPYADFSKRVVQTLNHNPVELKPEQVAKVIVKAALTRHPRRKYRVGILAKVLLALHDILPDLAWDGLARMFFPMP